MTTHVSGSLMPEVSSRSIFDYIFICRFLEICKYIQELAGQEKETAKQQVLTKLIKINSKTLIDGVAEYYAGKLGAAEQEFRNNISNAITNFIRAYPKLINKLANESSKNFAYYDLSTELLDGLYESCSDMIQKGKLFSSNMLNENISKLLAQLTVFSLSNPLNASSMKKMGEVIIKQFPQFAINTEFFFQQLNHECAPKLNLPTMFASSPVYYNYPPAFRTTWAPAFSTRPYEDQLYNSPPLQMQQLFFRMPQHLLSAPLSVVQDNEINTHQANVGQQAPSKHDINFILNSDKENSQGVLGHKRKRDNEGENLEPNPSKLQKRF